MLKNIPVLLEAHKARVVEDPTLKMIEKDGQMVPATDPRDGSQQWVVMLYIKPRPTADGRPAGKGSEVKLTLETEPGEEIEDGVVVELINPRVSHWENEFNGRTMSGLSWRATGIKLAG
ncbi:hypothetical protein HUO13_35600 [Saccharopolyspora erythraea]|uniref:hypothetical protein n=1 Tax=Saccharopolyspora erythraea TaxID=1836 RepID=UPI001BABB0D2|nr:hypothetical protein [Saccharopolyspora erythraea]QUH05400.1 hypothetical protein HUO13_35600 [Saccharopolyspora erythraea]